jgi:hypothetical protein
VERESAGGGRVGRAWTVSAHEGGVGQGFCAVMGVCFHARAGWEFLRRSAKSRELLEAGPLSQQLVEIGFKKSGVFEVDGGCAEGIRGQGSAKGSGAGGQGSEIGWLGTWVGLQIGN